MIHREVFDNLKTIAMDITDKRHRHSAAILYRGNVISYGVAKRKSHPFQSQYQKHEDAIFWHAETNAIHNALKKIEADLLSKCSLYVCRIRFKDDLSGEMMYGLSKPCKGCRSCINHFKIPTVLYTTNSPFHKNRFIIEELVYK